MELEDDFVSEALYRVKHENHKIMQFTGLLDKNGKEIYEGDKLRFSINAFSKPICKDTVYWCDYRACYQLKERGYMISSVCNIEVIGNIYDNKELLKEETK